MTLDDFKKAYGTNQHRSKLLSSLDKFLTSIKGNYSCYRVLAYGSFITEKEEPSDIDIMISIISTPKDKGFNKYILAQELADSNLDVFTLYLIYDFNGAKVLMSAEEMKMKFNSLPSHTKKGIECNSYIEICL